MNIKLKLLRRWADLRLAKMNGKLANQNKELTASNLRLVLDMARMGATVELLTKERDEVSELRDQAWRKFFAERTERVHALGWADKLAQELTDTRGELAETIAERDEAAKRAGQLGDEMAPLRGENMKLKGQIEDQAGQLEQMEADMKRLRHTTSAAEMARHAEALQRLEEQAERDRQTIEQLEAELAEARRQVRR